MRFGNASDQPHTTTWSLTAFHANLVRAIDWSTPEVGT